MIVCAVASFNIFAGLLSAIQSISIQNLNVALGILNIPIMMLSGLALDCSLVKITKNNQLKEELELKRQTIEKDLFLEKQSQELGKVLCKKNNIVYFPQK